MKTKKWMIYGANGYTGRLIVKQAQQRGLQPVVAGRNREAIEAIATETGLQSSVFDLDNMAATNEALKGVCVVLHCAGPFSATSQAMIDACLENACHYLDITGEISVFANAHRQSDRARYADIVLVPGVGFDVVPTDCLAVTLVKALPAATKLTLAFETSGRMSPGTAKTSIEGFARGGCVRRDGKLKTVPLAWKTREVPFENGNRLAVTIPWGDVFTAHISTGVPDIDVYMSASPSAILRMKRLRLLRPFLSMRWLQNMLKKRIERTVTGPESSERQKSQMQLWGKVTSADGRSITATMTTSDGYDVTVDASLGVVEYLLKHDVEGGFYTPSLLMGTDFALGLPGVSMKLKPLKS